MPLNYAGIESPKGGLTFHTQASRRSQGDAHGWLRLMLRPTQAPLLIFCADGNSEAYPERVSEFSLTYRSPLLGHVDPSLERIDLSLPCAAPAKVACWSKELGGVREISELRLRVTERTEQDATIIVEALAPPDARISIEGSLRIVAPDSPTTRAALATNNGGWLALSYDAITSINGSWDLNDGDLDGLPSSPDVLAADLEGNAQLTDAGIFPLSHLPNLQIAELSRTATTGIGLRAFGRLPHFRSLMANHTPLTDQGLSYLPGQRLTGLALNSTKVTDDGLQMLGATRSMRSLLLSNTFTGDRGILSLGTMNELEILSVRNTNVTDAVMRQLPDLCPNLETLDISETAVSDAAVPALAQLRRLTWIAGGKDVFSPTGIARMQKLRPRLHL
jgi:hypothetical protein